MSAVPKYSALSGKEVETTFWGQWTYVGVSSKAAAISLDMLHGIQAQNLKADVQNVCMCKCLYQFPTEAGDGPV